MIGKAPRADARKDGFSRREREIMEALYKLGKATAAEIMADMADPPSYTAIRTLLTILEKKGHISHTSDGPRYVYAPRVAREQMGARAIDTLLQTFFDNSVEHAVAALLSREDTELSSDQLDRLAAMIAKAKEEGR